MILTGSQITQALVEEIKSWPYAIACWEGGSAANQRSDKFSDVDLVLAVEVEKSEVALEKIESFLKIHYSIIHRWRVPAPTWHGHAQCFYKLENTPPFFFLDIVVMEANAMQRFLEVERHGNPVVYFDRKNFVKAESAASEDFEKKKNERLKVIEASFPFFKDLVLKEVARKRPIDTMAFYRSLSNLLIELLGMKYRPFRYDFGLRYTHLDFPEDVQAKLEKILYVTDMEAVGEQVLKIEEMVYSIVEDLKK